MIHKKNKRGISPVVATVLLLLITIAAIALLWGAVLPMFHKGLGASQACGTDTRLEINVQSGWTCYDSASNSVLVMVERPPLDFDLAGIGIQVSGEGIQINIEVRENQQGASEQGYNVYVRTPNGWNQTLELPGKGEARTYNITGINFIATQVGVTPIVKQGAREYTCQGVTQTLPPCSS